MWIRSGFLRLTKDRRLMFFYTDQKKFDVEELVEDERVVLAVRVQSIDYYGLKLGKFWLSQIVFPKKVMSTYENLISEKATMP